MLAAVSDSTPLGTVGYRVETLDEAEQRRQSSSRNRSSSRLSPPSS
jgi:hypothetical protein